MSKWTARPDLLEVGRSLFGSELTCIRDEQGYESSDIYKGGIGIGTASKMRFEFCDGRAFEIGISEWGWIAPCERAAETQSVE